MVLLVMLFVRFCIHLAFGKRSEHVRWALSEKEFGWDGNVISIGRNLQNVVSSFPYIFKESGYIFWSALAKLI